MTKKYVISFLFTLVFASTCFAQMRFSLSNDIGVQRSLKKGQQYWGVGHTVHGNFHFTPNDGAYAFISYYSTGKFSNDVNAIAKSVITTPQDIDYVNHAEMRFKHISMGWNHYFKGAFDAEASWSLYGFGGFGLLLGRVINTHSVSIDTNLYSVPVRAGKANFKRLSADLGLGVEAPIGADYFFYAEGRFLVPTSDYPSKYLLVNRNAPLVASLHLGIRILF